jgi:hypothetical protein
MKFPRIEWVAVLVSLALVASCSESEQATPTTLEQPEPDGPPATEPVPAAPTTPVATEAPETPIAAAEEIARGFLETRASDPDRAMSYVTEDLIAKTSGTPEDFRLEGAMLEALGSRNLNVHCEQQDASASGISVRCTYDYHTFRSDELGRDPFTGAYDVYIVRDGKIVAIGQGNDPTDGNAFFQQMWASFRQWVGTEHPDDIPVMYVGSGWRLTEESIALWERYTREYAEIQTREGFIGPPPEAAPPSTPESGELVVHL